MNKAYCAPYEEMAQVIRNGSPAQGAILVFDQYSVPEPLLNDLGPGVRTIVAAGAKLTQGRRLKTDPAWRGVLPSGGTHAGGGGSGGDPGLEQARQKHSRDRAEARSVAQHGAALFAGHVGTGVATRAAMSWRITILAPPELWLPTSLRLCHLQGMSEFDPSALHTRARVPCAT